MSKETRWQVFDMSCPEEGCPGSRLLLEWQEREGKWELNGVSCDNPRLKDLDNWECHWSCWNKAIDLTELEARRSALA